MLRQLTESGHGVTVVPTAAALRFVGEPTWAALSGRPVATDVWTAAHEVPHVRLGRAADLVLVVPATADLLARAVAGRADDLLTSTLLTATCPQVFAPAMHTEMWEHPATRANVATLRERGALVIEPASGRLTGADTGPGRLPDPLEIAAIARSALDRSASAAGRLRWRRPARAGTSWSPRAAPASRSTRCASSAIAPPAGRATRSLVPQRLRGAAVTLVSANVELPDVAGATVVRVHTAAELQVAVAKAAASCDAVVMTAAVADFRPLQEQSTKIKKVERRRTRALEAHPQSRRAGRAWCRSAPRSGQRAAGDRRLRRRDRRRPAPRSRETRAARAVTCSSSTRWATGRGFAVDHNSAVVLSSDGSEVAIDDVSQGPAGASAVGSGRAATVKLQFGCDLVAGLDL